MTTMSIKNTIEGRTAEDAMLLLFLTLGVLFFVEPIVQEYPDSATVFPQITSAIVIWGSLMLLVRERLPSFLQKAVTESVSITDTDDTDEDPTEDETTDDQLTLGDRFGVEIDDTVFMVTTAILYVVAGYLFGLLYVTPLFVLGYTSWFRVPGYVGLGIAGLATLVVFGFVELLLMPFDEGQLIFREGLG